METLLMANSLADMPQVIELLDVLLRAEPQENSYVVIFDIDDTLVREDSSPIKEVIDLLGSFVKMGCVIGLVTARHESMREFTIQELTDVGITPQVYKGEHLKFCPQEYRTIFTSISKWKQSARYFIKSNTKRKLLCTVGDQWTDLITIESDRERALLDDAYGSDKLRFVRLNDNLCLFGIKLPLPSETQPQQEAQEFLASLAQKPKYLWDNGTSSVVVQVTDEGVQEIRTGVKLANETWEETMLITLVE
jgi:hypothetical protein